MKKLTEKQEAFAKAYYTPASETFGNGTQSAKVAGYRGNDNVLHNIAIGNLRNNAITRLKQEIQAENQEKLQISQTQLLAKFKSIAEKAEANNDNPSVLRALENIGKHIGFYEVDNTQKSGKAIQQRITAEQQRILLECADVLLRKDVVCTQLPSPDND